MNEDKNKMEEMSFAELLDTLELPEPYRFPCENYKIVGDIGEIDRVINTCGYINIDVRDIEETLSNETINYVSTGSAEGPECVANALKDAVSNLPIPFESISNVLLNVWTPEPNENTQCFLKEIIGFANKLPVDMGVFWGAAFDKSLKHQQAKVTLIAASRN